MKDDHILEIKDLEVCFHLHEGVVKAVNGVSYQLDSGKTLGLVGESGSGKSVSALSILQLIDQPPGEFRSGKILFEGKDILALTEREMQNIRGRLISMIFQEPMTSLNPLMAIGTQIKEVLRQHQKTSRSKTYDRAVELLRLVDIPLPENLITKYSQQLSGGMRQRVMIAMALACNPKVLIADEPTTALDVTIQAQILDLLTELQEEMGLTILLITHDLGVIAEMANRVAVMYAGLIVEEADVFSLFLEPLHPYTRSLLASMPRIDKSEGDGQLNEIPGTVPDLLKLPKGCSFFDRCRTRLGHCRNEGPILGEVDQGRKVRCWLY